jgi:hypothetical protein
VPPTKLSLRSLKSFGDVAAEDDSVLDYFLKTDAVGRIQNNELFLILGRKGSGKTALVRYFSATGGGGAPTTLNLSARSVSLPLSLKGYPWNVHAVRVDRGAAPIEAYVASWRYLIALEVALLAHSTASDKSHPQAKAIEKFANENFGAVNPALGDILRPRTIQLATTSIEPELYGFKLGGVRLERKSDDLELGRELTAVSNALLQAAIDVASASGINSLLLHFDELDQGIVTFDESRRVMLVGLILAARDIRRETKERCVSVNPVIYLRTDLWDDLAFSDKNKINETSALNLEWKSDQLLELVNVRLRVRVSTTANWDAVNTRALMRGSQSKWNHILARTFLRPRDVIRFLNATLDQARRRTNEPLLIDSEDVTNARDAYSAYLKKELDDEIIAHWPQWEEALQACSAISTITFAREEFVREFEKRRSTENKVSAEEALKMLYQFSVIGYDRRSGYGGSSWVFQYANPEAGWDNSAGKFKVHLGLKEYAKLREERAQAEMPKAKDSIPFPQDS